MAMRLILEFHGDIDPDTLLMEGEKVSFTLVESFPTLGRGIREVSVVEVTDHGTYSNGLFGARS